MMEPLNYLRQATEQLRSAVPIVANRYPKYAEHISELLDECAKAKKFIMPVGGRIFDDGLRALPEDARLPFPEIVIEYRAGNGVGLAEQNYAQTTRAPKRIVYAQQDPDSGWIDVVSICCRDDGMWFVLPYIASITCREKGNFQCPHINGADRKIVSSVGIMYFPMGELSKAEGESDDDWEKRAVIDMNDETNAVLSLVEALSCTNVGIDAIPPRKQNKSSARRGALPFDTYHTLMVKVSGKKAHGNGGHFNDRHIAREHLRRGHIRRHQSAGNIWVNSCVVNAGTAGKIIKDYKVAA